MPGHFDKRLLHHIENGRNDEAMAMLNEELARAYVGSDTHGTLLHHEARHNNAVIARRLIELGADVDRLEGCKTTPLTSAVQGQYVDVAQVLLEANARIDLVDGIGCSALKVALDWFRLYSPINELLICKLKTLASTSEELADMLIRTECNMYHAAALGDLELMECMSKRGVDVNSKGDFTNISALHVAAELEDVKLANWLLKKGIDVDTLDIRKSSALKMSAERGNAAMVQLLLEHGACPDAKEEVSHECMSLYVALDNLNFGVDKFVECAELLLQHGASLQDFEYVLQLFRFALRCPSDKAAKLLIAHLAMLEVLDKPVDQSFMYLLDYDYRARISKLMREYYKPCEQILAVKVFEKWSLLDLLNASECKMRFLARKETFIQEVKKFSSEHKLSECYSYYYNTMMRRMEKTSRVVKLEDEAILVICKIFEANINQFYDFARAVVEYLNERDLESLVQV